MKEIKQLEWDYNPKKCDGDIYETVAISKIDNTGFDYFYYKAEFHDYYEYYCVRLWCRNSGQTISEGKTLEEAITKANEWHYNFLNTFLL